MAKKTFVPSSAWKKDRVFHWQKLHFLLPILRQFPKVIQFSRIRAKRHSWLLVWSLIWEWPKVHCDKPAPKQMPLNKICIFFVFSTSFFAFFLDGARTARWFFPAVRTKSHFSIPSRRRKIKTKKTAVPSRVAFVPNFVPSPSPRYAVFLTAEKNESARYGGRKKNSRTQSPTSENPRTFDHCVIQHCRT